MFDSQMEKENNTLNKCIIIGLSILAVIVVAINLIVCFS